MDYDNIVIAFAGCARSGKTTAAEYTKSFLDNLFGIKSEIMSFAGPLKEGLGIMGVHKDTDYELYRRIAQQVGTDFLRKHNNDWWVDLMESNIQKYFEEENASGRRGVVVIDDVRFTNESSMVENQSNGFNVFIYGGSGRIDLDAEVYKHASENLGVYFERITRGLETDLDGGVGMDRIIDNSKTLENLNINIASLCRNIILKEEQPA